MDTNHSLTQIADLATQAAQIVLQSGGETHRVEAIIHRVCHQFGFEKVESFVTPTGIFLSVWDHDGHVATSIKRINSRSVDLDKIAQISRLCQAITTRNLTPEQFAQEMRVLELRTVYPLGVQLFFGGVCAGFYSLLFGGGWLDVPVAFLVGLTLIVMSRLLYKAHFNIFLINAIGGGLAVLISHFAGLYLDGLHLDKIVIGSIMLLLPGLAIVNAIRDTMAGDLVAGTARLVEALFVAISVAAGTGSMLKLWYLVT